MPSKKSDYTITPKLVYMCAVCVSYVNFKSSNAPSKENWSLKITLYKGRDCEFMLTTYAVIWIMILKAWPVENSVGVCHLLMGFLFSFILF